jgi:hypothetical protein
MDVFASIGAFPLSEAAKAKAAAKAEAKAAKAEAKADKIKAEAEAEADKIKAEADRIKAAKEKEKEELLKSLKKVENKGLIINDFFYYYYPDSNELSSHQYKGTITKTIYVNAQNALDYEERPEERQIDVYQFDPELPENYSEDNFYIMPNRKINPDIKTREIKKIGGGKSRRRRNKNKRRKSKRTRR